MGHFSEHGYIMPWYGASENTRAWFSDEISATYLGSEYCKWIKLSVQVEKITKNTITSHDPWTPLFTEYTNYL